MLVVHAANTPVLELYTTFSRSQIDENEVILEESIDGMDMVAGVIFADAEADSLTDAKEGSETDPEEASGTDAQEGPSTDVTFRLGYYLPGKSCKVLCVTLDKSPCERFAMRIRRRVYCG